MTALAREAVAAEVVPKPPAADPVRLAEANVNPLTGLSTDYLNHFNEAVMLLEMLPSMPECRDDLAAWQPLDYRAHFMRSQLAQRDLTIAAYEGAEPRLRRQFDALCATMTSTMLAAQSALSRAAPPEAATVAEAATAELKRRVAQASAVIHGHGLAAEAASIQASQAAVDAILDP